MVAHHASPLWRAADQTQARFLNSAAIVGHEKTVNNRGAHPQRTVTHRVLHALLHVACLGRNLLPAAVQAAADCSLHLSKLLATQITIKPTKRTANIPVGCILSSFLQFNTDEWYFSHAGTRGNSGSMGHVRITWLGILALKECTHLGRYATALDP